MSVAVLKTLPPALAGQIRTAGEMARSRSHAKRPEGTDVGCPEIDRLIGGLRGGETTEIVGGRSSGRFSVVLQALATRTACGETAALVDLGDGLDPRSAQSFGVDLRRVLWTRPRTVSEALACAEAIVQTGMPLIVVDLGTGRLPGGKGRLSEAAWRRLTRAAAEHGTALLVSSPYRVTGATSRTVLTAGRGRGRWNVADASAQRPALLQGLQARFDLVRDQDHRQEESARIDFCVEDARRIESYDETLESSSSPIVETRATSDRAEVVPFPAGRPARRGRDSRRGRRYAELLKSQIP